MRRIEKRVLNARLVGLFCVDIGLKRGGDLTSKPRRQATALWDGLSFDQSEQDVHSSRLRMSCSREGSLMGKGTEMLNLRQYSAVSIEELTEIAARLGVEEVKAEWLGANLLIEGIPEMSKIPRGSRLFFPSGAVLQSSGDNGPCKHAASAVIQRLPGQRVTETEFIRAALERRGIVGFTVREGDLSAGDEIRVEIPKHWAYTAE